LPDLFPHDECETAEKLIAAIADKAAEAVKATIHAHKAAWKDKEQAEREKAFSIAQVWAAKHIGHRVKCPACECVAIVTGDPITAPKKTIDGDMITEKQNICRINSNALHAG
jgi:hypothetical protein